ncbi:hypothetical protein QM012_003588 [Aureobasidium pullulans]|uniref:Uncharacterized protein n=1 Tax=Aureobasidium pullulans TaxID=5580 RepID=A0ABR0T8V1_AURPU
MPPDHLRSHDASSQLATTSEITKLRNETERLKSENIEISKETDELRIETELLKTENFEMSDMTENLQTEITTLKSEKRQVSSDLSSLAARFDKLLNHDRIVCQERDHALQQRVELCADIEAKKGQIRELQKEILQYKKSLASSTRVDGQLSDMRIQDSMNGLFFAVRDWAIKSVRQHKTILDYVDKDTIQWLDNDQVTGYQPDSSMRKAYALITLFSDALCLSMSQNWIFGASALNCRAPDNIIDTANFLYASIEKIPGVTPERKKQWVLLTSEIVCKDENAVKNAEKIYVDALVCHLVKNLGEHPSVSTVGKELQVAIEPHVHFIQALYQQEADYQMILPLAANASERYPFLCHYMEDVNGEEKGMLQAVFFPYLTKTIGGDSGPNNQEIVVCKAKVVVQA